MAAGNSRQTDQARAAGAGSGQAGGVKSGAKAGEATGPKGKERATSAIERTLLAATTSDAEGLHEDVASMRLMFDTSEQHEALRTGEDSLAGLVLTTMESPEEVKRKWKQVRMLRARVTGREVKWAAAEISEEGEVKVATGLVCDFKCIAEWDDTELEHYVDTTGSFFRRLDERDGSDFITSWTRFLTMTRAKKTKFWGLGIRKTAATAKEDLRVTLNLMSALRWLVKGSEIGGTGQSLSEIWREFMEEAGGHASLIHLQTPERLKALKKAGVANPSPALPGLSLASSPGGPAASPNMTGLVWGPEPGFEPTPEMVRETEVGFFNPNFCKNCQKDAGHPAPLCPEPRRPELPCVFCLGRHREWDCPGPGEGSRAAFEVRKKFYFQRVHSSMPRRYVRPGRGGKAGQGNGDAGGGGGGEAPSGG
mmetsp:Transcript_18280/g.37034  ORF Transcript_18280/g.37034 Transcript_18280/m.37034 type:complete len:423 (+) Transcript_18280:1794-3062(+)